MVLKKRLDYGFSGYQVPVIPRGPRSVRRRASHNKTVEDSQICPFELLAAVAGKLLQESQSSASSNASEEKDPTGILKAGIKQEKLEEGKSLRSECLDQGSCVESVFFSGFASQKKSSLGEFPYAFCNKLLECTSVISTPDFSKKIDPDVKLKVPDKKTAVKNFSSKVEEGSLNCGECGYIEDESKSHAKADGNHHHIADLTEANTNSSKDQMEIHVNAHQLIHSDSSVHFPLHRDSAPDASFPRHGNKGKLGRLNDDKITVGRNRPSFRKWSAQPRIGHRRIRKLLTSKYWKTAPKLKDCEFSNSDGGMKSISCSRKALYNSERIQSQVPFKKRKLCDHSSVPAYNREESSESISNSLEKGIMGDKIGSAMKLHRARGVSSSVKFSIKSFKVPELYVEVPETATVGSLKRTVMEAVTAILQGGLCVGVLVQGKKVKDDNRSLLQTGICHNENMDALGFTLEPCPTIASSSLSPRDPPTLQPHETYQQLTRSPASPISDPGLNASFDPPPVSNVDNHVESNHELDPSRLDGILPDSKALVAIPTMAVEPLAAVPVSQKSRRPELVHRRTRRPFSVTEVEALVEAVETLGTGRWRDVKLRAFEDADHRTYVDLKDKWKTLVHTASISPQQRRGLPVPQELLDRVLSAHSYWSHHLSKQHGKHQAEPLTISEA